MCGGRKRNDGPVHRIVKNNGTRSRRAAISASTQFGRGGFPHATPQEFSFSGSKQVTRWQFSQVGMVQVGMVQWEGTIGGNSW